MDYRRHCKSAHEHPSGSVRPKYSLWGGKRFIFLLMRGRGLPSSCAVAKRSWNAAGQQLGAARRHKGFQGGILPSEEG